MPKLLIVEDDADIVENLSALMEDEGYSVCHASDTKSALNKLQTENIDLVLLDITLPDGNGYSICTAVKRATNAPVIFLTAMTDESSIITGFQLGADDYITKPFKPMELIYRVRNALRKSGKTPSVFQVQDLHIDAAKGIVPHYVAIGIQRTQFQTTDIHHLSPFFHTSVSSRMVTGPSFSNRTCISAPNSPV